MAARGAVDRSGAAMQASMDKRLAALSASTGRLGSSLSRSLTLPITALGVATGELAVKFQQSMEQIHTQAGASQAEVAKLGDQVLALAKTVPQGPNALAQGLYHLESIGLRGANAMTALKVAAEGAAVGNADLESTATALGSAWLVNIKGAGDLQHTMAVLNAAVGAGNMRMQDLVTALGTGLLPSAKAAGLSLQNIMAAMTILTDEGYQASSASAQLATALHFLYAPSAKANKALEGIGLDAAKLSDDLRSPGGLMTALQDLKNHMQDLSTFDQQQVLNALMPAGRGRVLLTLYNQLDRYGMKLDQIARTTSQFNSDVVATQQTAAYKIHTAWSGIEADAIQFGQAILPPLLSVGQTVVGIVGSVATAFSKLPSGAQHAIVTGGLILASIGPALKIISAVSGLLGKAWSLGMTIERLLAGGPFRAPGQTTGLKASMLVDTMEVGTLIARGMIGEGPGASMPFPMTGTRTPVGTSTTTTATVTTAEEAAATGVAASLASKIMGGLMAGGLGLAVGSMLQEAIPGLKHGMVGTLAGSGLGAAIGTVIAPGVGTAIGAGLGATLGPTLAHLLDTDFMAAGRRDGQIFTDQFTRRLGPGVQASLQAAFQQAAKQAGHDVAVALPHAVPGAPTKTSPGTIDVGARVLVHVTQPTPAQIDKLASDTQHALELAFQGHPISPDSLLAAFRAQLAKTPSPLKDYAAQAMLQFAAELRDKGRLGEQAFQAVVAFLEKQGAALQAQLGLYGNKAASTLAQDFKFTQAQSTLRDTMVKFNDQWQTGLRDQNATGQQMITDAGKLAKNLKDTIVNGTAEARKEASANLKQLQTDVAGYFSSMLSDVQAKQAALTAAVQNGSSKAAQEASTNFSTFSKAVYAAMAAGVLSSAQGAKILEANTNAILKTFQAKGVPLAAIQASIPPNSYDTFTGPGGRPPTPHARGGHVRSPTIMVGEEAPQHPEVVIATNPAYRKDNLRYWAQAGRMLGIPGFATGGYVYPIGSGAIQGRIDQGVDFTGGPFEVAALGPGTVVRDTLWPGWPGTGGVVYRLTQGPMAGRLVYQMEHQVARVRTGQQVQAGQIVTESEPGYPWLEIGWANSAGTGPLTPYNGAPDGTPMPGGQSFFQFISGLAHGKLTGVAVPTVKAPTVLHGGTIGREVQASLNKQAAAANKLIASKAPKFTPGSPGAIPNLSQTSGPVMSQMYQAGKQLGLTALSIAGEIGNAYQESSLNPSMQSPNGIGLFSWIASNPQYGSVQLGNVAEQMALANSAITVSAMNAASTSPAAAAIWFEQNFEHAGTPNMPNRIAAAQRAYSMGYARGGVVKRKPGDHDPGKLAREYPQVWAYIRKRSPDFPPGDLGSHWLNWLGHSMSFKPVAEGALTQKYLNSLVGWLNDVTGSSGTVAKIQERAQYLGQSYGSNPSAKQQATLVDLDRQAVAWLLRAAQGLDKVIGNGTGHGVLDKLIADLEHNKQPKGWPKASASTISTFKQLRSTLDQTQQSVVGLSGIGGMLGDAEYTLEQQIQSGVPASTKGQKKQALVPLLQQRIQNLQEKLFVSQAQYKVFEGLGSLPGFAKGGIVGLPPFGGVFHNGGVVPGYRGQERTIIAQAGERVSKGDGTVHVIVHDGAVDPKKIEVIADGVVKRHDRRTAMHAHRMLPSRGGGRLGMS